MSKETETSVQLCMKPIFNSSTGTSNKDWWPNQLNLNILHQHDQKGDPMMRTLIMLKSLKNLIMLG